MDSFLISILVYLSMNASFRGVSCHHYPVKRYVTNQKNLQFHIKAAAKGMEYVEYFHIE